MESAIALDSRQRPALKAGLDQGIVFTHPHGQVENPTAPSAGDLRSSAGQTSAIP
ncbi:MAG: hypothetical protein ACOX52_13285 [Verrucomicrobiota bacterium]